MMVLCKLTQVLLGKVSLNFRSLESDLCHCMLHTINFIRRKVQNVTFLVISITFHSFVRCKIKEQKKKLVSIQFGVKNF